jgi:hypothetical protein
LPRPFIFVKGWLASTLMWGRVVAVLYGKIDWDGQIERCAELLRAKCRKAPFP